VKQQIDLLSNNHLKTAALGINSFKSEQKNLDVDIIITTPGRLLDHLDFEPGLLNCLEFLVMDEADRLMNQHYQGWLNRVLGLFQEPKPMLSSTHSSDILKGMSMQTKKRVRKLLFSATLSHNPAKIEMLKLVKPVLITLSEEKYSLPLTLLERYYTTQKQQKPLLLLSILESNSLIFVKSVQGSQRLFTLIKTALDYLDKNISCGLITSGMLNKDREKIIKQFKRGDVGVLFCSDVLSRGSIILTKGIDLGEARYVFNYDIPSSFVTYVHRVGRTARAGQSGTAITLVEQGQLSWFKSEIIKPITRNVEELTETLNGKYEDAYMKGLKELKRIFGNKQIEDDEQDDKQETVDKFSIEAKENLAVSSTSDECTSSSENE
jgi:ATP-dependent RNA helicase DDX51/DBP6